MTRKRLSIVICGLLMAANVGIAQDFELSSSGAATLSGDAGSIQSSSYVLEMTHLGTGTGAQGWSYGIAASSASISDITIAGTVAESLLNPDPLFHFVVAELTTGPGNEGAVSAVVLDFIFPTTLPTGTTSSIAVIEVSAEIPAGGGGATIQYQDGLQGSGQPVDCVVTELGQTAVTIKTPTTVTLEETGPAFSVNFVGPGSLSGPAGSTAAGSYTLNMTHDGPGSGAQGFSLGLTADDASITDITIEGSVAESLLNPNPLFHFVVAELTSGPGNEGAVMAVVLDFIAPTTLPTNTTSSIGFIDVGADIPAGGGTATLRYAEGLQGSGQPVACIVTQAGQSEIPEKVDLNVALEETAADSDGDGIPDDEDACPNSDLSPTVVIGDCDSGVTNHLLPNGCTIKDRIDHIQATAANPIRAIIRTADLLRRLKRRGVITRHDARAILVCLISSYGVGHMDADDVMDDD